MQNFNLVIFTLSCLSFYELSHNIKLLWDPKFASVIKKRLDLVHVRSSMSLLSWQSSLISCTLHLCLHLVLSDPFLNLYPSSLDLHTTLKWVFPTTLIPSLTKSRTILFAFFVFMSTIITFIILAIFSNSIYTNQIVQIDNSKEFSLNQFWLYFMSLTTKIWHCCHCLKFLLADDPGSLSSLYSKIDWSFNNSSASFLYLHSWQGEP